MIRAISVAECPVLFKFLTFWWSTLAFRQNLTHLALASVRPSFVLSLIRCLSTSATAARILKTIYPIGPSILIT